MKDFWESRYGNDDYAYGKSPNLFFKETIDQMKPGILFLPGEGEGRNAVYAAKSGWEVDATDLAETGREKASRLASEHDVLINYKTGDLNSFSLKFKKYDLIALIFVHLPPSQRSVIHGKLVESLKKNGVLILESFSKRQMGQSSGGPQNLDLLYDKDTLKSDFRDLSIESLYETEQDLNEGQYHQGKSYLIRLTARKL
jgi:hypothetical protein